MKYTKEKVDEMIFDTIKYTIKGFEQFLDKEVIVVKKGTKEEIEDCELELKENYKKIADYIHPLLKEHAGIVIIPKSKEEQTVAEQQIAKKKKDLFSWLFGTNVDIKLYNQGGDISTPAPVESAGTRKGMLCFFMCGGGFNVKDNKTGERYQIHNEDRDILYKIDQTTCNSLTSLVNVKEVEYILEGEFARIPSLQNNVL